MLVPDSVEYTFDYLRPFPRKLPLQFILTVNKTGYLRITMYFIVVLVMIRIYLDSPQIDVKNVVVLSKFAFYYHFVAFSR